MVEKSKMKKHLWKKINDYGMLSGGCMEPGIRFWTIIMEGKILSLFGPTQMPLCCGKMQTHSNNTMMHLSNTSGRGQIKISKIFTSGIEKHKKARWCVRRG